MYSPAGCNLGPFAVGVGKLAFTGFLLDLIYWKQLPTEAGNIVNENTSVDLKTKTMNQNKPKDHIKLA